MLQTNGNQVESEVSYRILNFLGKLHLEMTATHLHCRGQRVSPEHIPCVTISPLKATELSGIGGREGFNGAYTENVHAPTPASTPFVMPKRQVISFFSAVTYVILRNFTNEARGIDHINGLRGNGCSNLRQV